MREKDMGSVCSARISSPRGEFKDMHQRQFHAVSLCCLFDASQLITIPLESLSLSASLNSKHHSPVGAEL